MGQIRDTEQGEHPDRLELAVIELVRLVHFTDRLLINIAGDLGFYVPCMFVALLGSGSWEVSRLPCGVVSMLAGWVVEPLRFELGDSPVGETGVGPGGL